MDIARLGEENHSTLFKNVALDQIRRLFVRMDFINWMNAMMLSVAMAVVAIGFVRTRTAHRRSKAASHVGDWPVVRMLPGLLANMHNLYDWLTELLIENGGSFQFWGPWLTDINYYFTADPRNVEHVLRLRFDNYPKGPDFTSIFKDLLGNGIFNVDHEPWSLQRKASSLQLNSRDCKAYTNETIITCVNGKLLPILQHLCASAARFDLQDLMLRFTFDLTCIVGFGMDTGCLSRDLPCIPFASSFEHALDCTVQRFTLPSSWWQTLKLLKIGKEKGMQASIRVIDGFIGEVISTRRREISIRSNACPASKADLLSCFMRLDECSGDEGFLKDISINFLLAGRDTSALALSWFFWLVATHPHVEEKLVREVKQVLGSLEKPGVLSTGDAICRLVYLHAALSESLRLYPSVPLSVKQSTKDDVLPDGKHIKKNQKVIYSMYSMGRMQSIWGPDCATFRPERWLSEDGASCRRDISPFRFTAFNAGPRICLGKDMAYFLMKTLAATLLFHFRATLVPGHKVVPKLSITLYMRHGLLVTLQPRESREP